VSRRAAAQRRSQNTGAPADRPRQRRSLERAGSPAVARAMLHGVEVREQPDPADGSIGFRAYASVTEHAYDMWDMFGPYTETIASTAFDETLAADPDVTFLLNHGGMTLARTASGTLTIGTDDNGLFYEPRLDPANSIVRDVMSGVRRGDLSESSFAFRIIRGSWSPDWTAYRIEQVDLHRGDVSIVNFGANPGTGDFPIGLGDEGLDVDQLDDQQALALTSALEQRTARRAAAERGAAGTAELMSPDELAALRALAAPHPLAARVRK
jgi:HK97 family phage prohead protease